MMDYGIKHFRIVKEFIGDYDEKIHVRELERRTGIDIKSLHSALKELVSFNVLDFIRKGKLKLYFLKKSFDSFTFLNLVESYESFLFLQNNKILKPFLNDLKKVSDFIIFGSFASKKNVKDSDLDIVVLSKNNNIKKLLSLYNINCHFQFSDYGSFFNKFRDKDNLALEIVKNHVLFCNVDKFNRVVFLGQD